MPYIATLLLFHPLLRNLWNRFYPTKGRADSGQARLDQRASFDRAFALLFLVILHGVSAFKVFTILLLNYQLATKLPRKYVPAATWIFNLSTLFANELCNGYHFKTMFSLVSPPVMAVVGNQIQTVDSELMQLGDWLDGFRGLLVRWEVLFNFTILRLISFNLDYYWSLDRSKSNALEVCVLNPLLHRTRLMA